MMRRWIVLALIVASIGLGHNLSRLLHDTPWWQILYGSENMLLWWVSFFSSVLATLGWLWLLWR